MWTCAQAERSLGQVKEELVGRLYADIATVGEHLTQLRSDMDHLADGLRQQVTDVAEAAAADKALRGEEAERDQMALEAVRVAGEHGRQELQASMQRMADEIAEAKSLVQDTSSKLGDTLSVRGHRHVRHRGVALTTMSCVLTVAPGHRTGAGKSA